MSKNTPINGLTYDPITRRVSTPRLNDTQKLALALVAMIQVAVNIINIAQGGSLLLIPLSIVLLLYCKWFFSMQEKCRLLEQFVFDVVLVYLATERQKGASPYEHG